MNYKLILSLILACLVLLFIIQNAAVAEIHFLLWTFSMSGGLMIFLVLIIGVIIGWLLRSFMGTKEPG
jgi:uncharacterized integral membrane protein